MDKYQYNDEPVYYCKSCLSLKVLNDTGLEGLDYCDECGSTNIDTIHIEIWQKLYKERYGFDYLNNKY